MQRGAFQTSREIFNNAIWSDIPKFRIFFFIVGNAVFAKDGIKHAGIKLKRGQFLRSYRNLRDDLEYIENRSIKKYSISMINRKISSLIDEERLEKEETELGTLFTVVNYEQYQVLDNYKKGNLERTENSDGTEMEQQRNNNKNVKKDKNVKNEEKDRQKTITQMKDLLSFFSSINNFKDINEGYWDTIKETRQKGKIAESVIINNMTKWKRYDLVVVEYALKEHTENHRGKREEYTLGIMRGTTPEEANKPVKKSVKGNSRVSNIDWDSLKEG